MNYRPRQFDQHVVKRHSEINYKNRLFSAIKKDLAIKQQKSVSRTNITTDKVDKKKDVIFIYNYWVGPGNNPELIKRIMATRENWIEVTENEKCHFRWAQSERTYKYDLMNKTTYSKQMVNHFEHHSQISDKAKLIRNLNQYAEANKFNMFNFTPPTFIIDFSDGFCDKFLHDFLLYYAKFYPKSTNTNQINKMRMDYLYYFKYLINGHGDRQKPLSNKYCVYLMLQTFLDKNNNNYLWLLKPTFLNRGRGVRVFSELQTLKEYFRQYMQGFAQKVPTNKKDTIKQVPQNFIKTEAFVIQKYIERPMLIDKRKFDIRTWTLIDHEYNVYFFKEGYVRMSSENFDLSTKNLQNSFIHLTNNAIQKYNENYCKFESGNQLSFLYLEKYIKENYSQLIANLDYDTLLNKSDIFFQTFITGKMKEIVRISTNSIRKKINPNQRKFCMEIFGYDFMIDEKLNVWLIEVNTNPCIEQSSPLLKQLIPRMLNDAFKLTIDVFFPKWNYSQNFNTNTKLKIIETRIPQRAPSMKIEKFRVNGYEDQNNLWEYVCNINPITTSLKKKRIF